jgi:SAM-dependent methyltransferase
LGNKNLVGLPTPSSVMTRVQSILSSLNDSKKITFIDFGCGEGFVLSRVHHLFNQSFGIELNKIMSDYAYQRFNSVSCVTILHQDMVHYTFTNQPTVLYMYEPLWEVTEQQVVQSVYQKVFDNLKKVTHQKYVIYVTSVLSPKIKESDFHSYHLEIIHKERISRSLFFHNTIYFLRSI